MKVLMTGAGGFIGSAILERLLAGGHQVVAWARNSDNLPNHPDVLFRPVELNKLLTPGGWVPLLDNVQAVINCAGILREHRGGDFERIHHTAPLALAQACQQESIRPFVQVSALGEPEDGGFVASKHRLDQELLEMDLPVWVLRPSVVISLRGSYGGTSAMRAAAAVPAMLVLPGRGNQQVQPLLLEDLSEMVVRAVEQPQGCTQPLTAAGPEVMTLRDLLLQLRGWLKLPPPSLEIHIPARWVTALADMSDRLHLHPMGRTTWRMLQRGNTADEGALENVDHHLGTHLQSVTETLKRSASFAQDRWHARLKLLAPLGWLALVMIWLISGTTGLVATPQQYQPVLSSIGIPEHMQSALTLATGVLNLTLGLLLFVRWQMRGVLWLMLVSVLAYTAVLGVGNPALWLDLTGGLIKNAAIMALIAFLLVTHNER